MRILAFHPKANDKIFEKRQVFWLRHFLNTFPLKNFNSGFLFERKDSYIFLKAYSYGDSVGFAPTSLLILQEQKPKFGAKVEERNETFYFE